MKQEGVVGVTPICWRPPGASRPGPLPPPPDLPGGSAAGSERSTYQCVAHLASQGLPFQLVLQAECLTELCWGCSLPTEA